MNKLHYGTEKKVSTDIFAFYHPICKGFFSLLKRKDIAFSIFCELQYFFFLRLDDNVNLV